MNDKKGPSNEVHKTPEETRDDETRPNSAANLEKVRIVVPYPSVGTVPSKFATNQIKTSRYTVVTFLPLSILIQFTKIANIAWLCVMILNSFP